MDMITFKTFSSKFVNFIDSWNFQNIVNIVFGIAIIILYNKM